ncbi:MAG: PAS domain S-box protein [Planctomycetota bacterium]
MFPDPNDGAEFEAPPEPDLAPADGFRRDRRDLLTALLETTPDAILTLLPDGTVAAINRGALLLFDCRRGDLLGLPLAARMPLPHRVWFAAELARHVATGASRLVRATREIEVFGQGGGRVPAELTTTEIQSSGGRRFLIQLRDVRERLHLQEQLRRERDLADRLIETAPTMVAVLDLDGRLMRGNRMFFELTGYVPDEVHAADWFETFLAPADRAPCRETFTAILSGQRRGGSAVATVVDRHGSEHRVQWHSARLQDSGETIGVLAMGLDVTETLHTEEMLVRSQKMEALARLTGGIAHDFNNLLMGVLGCCHLAIDLLDDVHPARPLLEEIHRSSERSVKLVRRLLTFSRREPAARTVVDLAESVRDLVGITEQLVGEDIAIELHLAPEPATVLGDPAEIEQVLMNLIVNARDAMKKGGRLEIRVRVEERPVGERGGRVVLQVADSGIGMTREVRSRVFEPFFTTKSKNEGTGLGLTTVFGIVERMNGSITVDSEPGEGTCFTVSLPRCEARTPLATAQVAPDRAARTAEGKTVLLVEDEALVRTTLASFLQRLGYTVLVASCAREALAAVSAGAEFDVLLTDVVLPEVGGPELAAEVRAARPKVRVLFMSAHAHEHLVQSGRLQKDDPSLEKPFREDELERRLRQLLDDEVEHGDAISH